ncbi:zinc-dependent alcohol dehydrogenase family protein [Anaeromyxobacter sp. Fw109-5]|uniref:zinc-dependent alcohol dehydrogenase family protein n=1 Tax=Anaeromyxobacter sp. (strain Fw109-5) TaxID=404589 RepID=UPI0000ED6D0C|nr:zinc-dependent alcohol dehydrogenase family protein [Anaeromyxobacter sp. Fw109-5]ABS28307.1 Alcohol dehydrogenase zinc-binding type 2 [Anaeromyxobacter sp. Fw109-5]
MRAMVVEHPGRPLAARELPAPEPGPDEILVRVLACGVCRTDLHLADGELALPGRPVVPGHEIVGEVVRAGPGVTRLAPGQLAGIAWLGWACGTCRFCASGRENLCERARFTGWQRDGGYAEYAVADARFAFPLPPGTDPVATAPLLCAGLIGHRAWRMAGEARRLGIFGFGAAGHILAQVARHAGQEVLAFTRPGDEGAQRLARDLGAAWAGGSDAPPPALLDAAVIFAPVGALVPAALSAVAPGGTVVCAGIHMSDIPAFPYALLWGERVLRSVANLTRADGEAFLALAPQVPVRCAVTPFPLAAANEALELLRAGRIEGAAVLVPE